MRIYVESTIPSYVVARPARDLLQAARQQLAKDWWDWERNKHELFTSQVVLDEIAAMPICFLAIVTEAWVSRGKLPPVEWFFSGHNLLWTILIFVVFRLFDIAKPWPIRQSQRLPGGWGVTVDDVLAAVDVAIITLFLPK